MERSEAVPTIPKCSSAAKNPMRRLVPRIMNAPPPTATVNEQNTSRKMSSKEGFDPNVHAPAGDADDDGADAPREQDMYLPIANVVRLMRQMLPSYAKIADDAKDTVQECVSEYIGFITGEANDRCRQEQRKTITAEDLLLAMSKLGFDDYVGPLVLYLQRYREVEGDARGSIRGTLRFEPPLNNPAAAVKGASSDSGPYVQQLQYSFTGPAPGLYPNPVPPSCSTPQHPYLQFPQAFLPGAGSGSSYIGGGPGMFGCYRPETYTFRDMPSEVYRELSPFLEVVPSAAQRHVGAGADEDVGGPSSLPKESAAPRNQVFFPGFDPSTSHQ